MTDFLLIFFKVEFYTYYLVWRGLIMNDKQLTIKLSNEDLNDIDFYITAGEFNFRSDFIRYAIRECLDNHKKEIMYNMKLLQN